MVLYTKKELKKQAKEAYAINVKNGWWHEDEKFTIKKARNSKHLVLLMKSEKSEALECYRNAQHIDRFKWAAAYHNEDPSVINHDKQLVSKGKEINEYVRGYFKKNFKETVEMEVADIIIRVFDCMMGYDISFMDIRRVEVGDKDSLDVFIKIDELLHPLYHSTMNKEAATHFAVILSYLFSYDDNMMDYVRVKTIYNSTRGYMHGGKKA